MFNTTGHGRAPSACVGAAAVRGRWRLDAVAAAVASLATTAPAALSPGGGFAWRLPNKPGLLWCFGAVATGPGRR